MHHVGDLTECGKKLGRKGSGSINTEMGKRLFYSIYPFSRLVRRDPRHLHPCLLSSWLSLVPAAHSAFLRACTHLFSPSLHYQRWGNSPEGRAELTSIAKFTLLASTENSVKSWETASIQCYQGNHFVAVLLKASYIPVGLCPMPEVLALRRLRMESSRLVCDT